MTTTIHSMVAGDGNTTPGRENGSAVQVTKASTTVPTPPATSLDQRREALTVANRVRMHRAAVKRQLRGMTREQGEAAVAFILQCPDPLEWSWRIRDLLSSIRSYGPARVNSILIKTRTTNSRSVTGLSSRQREEIVQCLRGA